MAQCRFTDQLVHDGRLRKTDDGHVVQARVARGGNVQEYLGAELGGEFADKRIVRVYRPEEEVFSRDAISSYARKPITIGHPPEGVTDETWGDLAVGEIDRDVMRDGEFVSVPLLFRDAKATNLMRSEGGPKELSMGYSAQVVAKDGTTPKGEPYDAEMSGFSMNHVAVVPFARGGSELRIGDGAAQWGLSPLTDARKEVSMTTRKIMVDGLEVETTDAGAAAIQKLQGDITAKSKALTDAEAAHADAIAAKDKELATKDGEIADLKGKVLSDEDIDKRVQDRAALIDSARKVAPKVEVTGLSDADIRRKAVETVRGADAMKDKSDAYIEAAFDMALEAAAKGKDTFRVAAADGAAPAPVADGDYGQSAYQKRISDAWKSPAAKEA